MTQLENLIKQYNIYITHTCYDYPNFRCQFVLPKAGTAYAVEGKNMRQMYRKMVELIEEKLHRTALE